ncbi:MAG TPA: DUF933 domain-containing protein [bacterium]|jgi:hypothetical protein
MRVGIIGLVGCGKSLLFQALTGQPPDPPGGKVHRRLGRALVPDVRVEILAELDKSEKKTFAEIVFIDPDGFNPQSGKSLSSEMLGMVRNADLLTLVIHAFSDPSVMHPLGSVDGFRDVKANFGDLIIQDLAVLEGKLQRSLKEYERGKKELEKEVETLKKAIAFLEEDKFLAMTEWLDYERDLLAGLETLTLKKGLVLWNVGEGVEFGRGGKGVPQDVIEYVESYGWRVGATCLTIEAEIMELEDSERTAFTKEYGLAETIRDRFLTTVYTRLGLITFYTSGPKEAAARPVKNGSTAYDAAGKIHSDIQRGFIRAEVMSFDDFVDLESVDAVRKAGKYRLEKKEYIVQDGDIIVFRFNV